jgi:hypothetical protein
LRETRGRATPRKGVGRGVTVAAPHEMGTNTRNKITNLNIEEQVALETGG